MPPVRVRILLISLLGLFVLASSAIAPRIAPTIRLNLCPA
jgi:hypothetical protein